MPFDEGLGNNLTIIYLGLDIGLWLSGACVWGLARRGLSILNARKTLILIAYCLMMAILFVPETATVFSCIPLLCLCVFGLGLWLANQQAFKHDVAFGRAATAAALVGAIETGFAAFAVKRVGTFTKDNPEYYNLAFILLASLFTLGVLSAFVLLRPKWINVREKSN